MNDILKSNNNNTNQQINTNHDLYANLLLSNLLEKEEKEEQAEDEKPIELTNDIIWVPAEKHPKIAPTEFAKFIEAQGANLPVKRAASLQRRNSVLSQSYTLEDDTNELARITFQKRKDDLRESANEDILFDHNSLTDNSRMFTPKPDKVLLRRSAFSARGRSKRNNQITRSTSERRPATSTDNWNKSEGVSLYDQPVNMSEWIDLGSASLESDDSSQRGILSRVHDAESQLRSHINNEEEVKEDKKVQNTVKRPSMKRPPPIINEKPVTVEKSVPWFVGLFQSKQGGLTSNNNLQSNALSNFATLFTRSSKPNNTNNSTTAMPKDSSTEDTIVSAAASNKKRKPSRLELPSTTITAPNLYNSNRLPLHVERAIYRLSHLKLAEPKRPLCQQVLISNLMFWYLSIQETILVQNNNSNNDIHRPSFIPKQQQQQQKKPSKMSRFIHAAKRRTQPQTKHIHFEEDDDLPLSHYRS
ncbi:hypothetical protein G6F43_009402 [Rhizopus delemar]|nr:hypothetical protein G6F43_009402 [Rhizopus delemar]